MSYAQKMRLQREMEATIRRARNEKIRERMAERARKSRELARRRRRAAEKMQTAKTVPRAITEQLARKRMVRAPSPIEPTPRVLHTCGDCGHIWSAWPSLNKCPRC